MIEQCSVGEMSQILDLRPLASAITSGRGSFRPRSSRTLLTGR
jgi:hypothetical protein